MNQISVLTGIPEFTKGYVKELRVRWALEEMGLPYEEVRYPHPETKNEEYKKLQPFGQVPYFKSGDLCMFETGAILLHLALKNNKLLPLDEKERAYAFTWLFAGLNSIEPYMFHDFFLKQDPEASDSMKEKSNEIVQERLKIVSIELDDRKFFGKSFSIADIIMTTILKNALGEGLLINYTNLKDYVERNESRPAFQRALHDHEKLYEVKK